jgi:hypothetical protein
MTELATQYKAMSTMISKMGGQLKMGSARGGTNMRGQNQQLEQMGKALSAANPQVLKQIGGMSGLKQMMKALDGGDMSQLQGLMGGGGGGGGMGGMGALAGMLGGGGGGRGGKRR